MSDDQPENVSTINLAWAAGKYGDCTWNDAIAKAEEIAAVLIAADEDEGDAPGTPSSLPWAKNYVKQIRDKAHNGDCSKCRSWLQGPWTCDPCVYDEYMLKAWQKMRADQVLLVAAEIGRRG